MAYLMFVDESGQDHRESPYEVLAGVAIHDSALWDLIREVKATEKAIFGTSYAHGNQRELKAKKLLHRKTFRHAEQGPEIAPPERTELAKAILLDGDAPSRNRLTALGQAKIAFVARTLDIAFKHHVHAFASIVEPSAPRPAGRTFLRKDYSYLFERFFHFVNAEAAHERGIIVFDEVEKSESHILLGQMMASPRRAELDPLGEKVKRLRQKPVNQGGYWVTAFKYIDDLRTREERGLPWPPEEEKGNAS